MIQAIKGGEKIFSTDFGFLSASSIDLTAKLWKVLLP